MLRYLPDTRLVIDVIKRRPLAALDAFNRHAGHMALSAITLAELLHGAEKSGAPDRALEVVEDFCSRLEVLPYGPKAAQHYGSIRAALERRGQPIGVNDLHIAAHAPKRGTHARHQQPARVRAGRGVATRQLAGVTLRECLACIWKTGPDHRASVASARERGKT